MQNKLDESPVEPFVPWLQLLTFGGYVLAAVFLFNLIAPLLALPFYNFDLNEMMRVMGDISAYPEARVPMLFTQAVYSLGAFILTPWFYITRYLKMPVTALVNLKSINNTMLAMTLVIIVSFMVVNSVFVYWNQHIQFPEALSWFESMARSMEDKLQEVTLFITDFQSAYQLILGLLVIAVLPGIGEELLFRGVLQNLIWKGSKNPHIAIWISAFIFGVFHLQFYGVVPRILLGALFGYIYFWSGRLSLAMIAHFLNNGITLVAVYMYNQGLMEYEITNTDLRPEWLPVVIFFVIGAFTMFMFYQKCRVQENGNMAEGL